MCLSKKFALSNKFRNLNVILMKKIISMKYPESCVINGGKTIPHFNLEIGNRQEDPILHIS